MDDDGGVGVTPEDDDGGEEGASAGQAEVGEAPQHHPVTAVGQHSTHKVRPGGFVYLWIFS